MMRSLFLYITDTLSDWEAAYVLAELRSGRYLKDPEMRYDIVFCGHSPDTVTTMGGIKIRPDLLVGDIRPDKGDILVLPGADTWLDPLHASAIEKVRKGLDRGTVVAAICGATLGLANAGLLDTRRHTSNDLAAIKMFCPGYLGDRFYINEPAVTDGNLVTASGLAPVDFACHIFRLMDVMTPLTLDAWYGLFSTGRPEYFHALMESVAGH